MIHMKERNGLVCVMLGIAVLLAGGHSARADDFEKFQERARAQAKKTISNLTEARGPSVVTLQFIAKETNFMGQQEKYEMEAPAVVLTPDGLLLAASSRLQGFGAFMMGMMGGLGGLPAGMPIPQSDVEDIKVIIGEDSEGLEAKIIARDSDLDLAWVQITDTQGQTFKHVDFNDAAILEVGDVYYTLSRMGERFDRALRISSASISAAVDNPRPLLIGELTLSWGVPVFSAAGKPAGLLVTQPAEQGEEGAISLEIFASSTGFILPAKKIVKATKQAQEIAKKQAAEDAKAAESAKDAENAKDTEPGDSP